MYFPQKTALSKAINKENLEMVALLMSNPQIDVNMKIIHNNDVIWKYSLNLKSTALIMAIEKGNLKIVKLLLSNPTIDINAKIIQKTVFLI